MLLANYSASEGDAGGGDHVVQSWFTANVRRGPANMVQHRSRRGIIKASVRKEAG